MSRYFHDQNKRLVFVWLALMGLTLTSIVLGESSSLTVFSGLLICSVVMVKSLLVIDYFMGLKFSHQLLRKLLYSYFIIIPLLVGFGILMPEWVVALTSIR